MLRLSLLGPPVVRLDGQPVSFDTRKAVALLAVLAVERRPQPRDRLAAMLWPEGDALRARSALRRTLSVTTASTGGAVVADRSLVELDPARVSADIDDFRQLVGAGRPEELRQAMALVRDDFLAGFVVRGAPGFADWQAIVAASIRRDLGRALQALVDHSVGRGELEPALADAQRWLALDPLHEPAHQALIRLYAWSGQRSAALQQYRECVRVLDDELGVAPLDETTELADAVRLDRLPPPIKPPLSSAAIESTAVTHAPLPPTDQPVSDARLVGRDRELAILRPAFVGSSPHRVVAVTGTTGVGKSALLQAALAAAPTAARPTVSLRCHKEEQSLAGSTAAELLRGLTAAAPDLLTHIGPQSRAELSRLLPDLAPLEQPEPDRDGAGRARLFAAVNESIGRVDDGPVVVIDDAHWLDRLSSELFAYLIRRLAANGMVVVLAWASEAGLPESLAVAIADTVAAATGVELSLAMLDHDDVSRLLSERGLDPAAADRLLRQTGGLPLLVNGYLQAQSSGPSEESTPQSVRAALSGRLAGLSETARQVVAAAAVIGTRIDPDVLRETCGRGEAETVAAIEEAQRLGVIVESAAGDGYDFPYEAMRTIVLDELTLARRRLLHGRAADALAPRLGRQPMTAAGAGVLARHLSEAGRPEQAASWHLRAARAAGELGAPVAALAELQAASALGLVDDQTRVFHGELLITLGRYRDARMALEQAAAATTAPARLAEIERRLADLHHRLGDLDTADSHLAAALELLTSTPLGGDDKLAGERSRVLAERALVAHRRLDDEATIRYATQAADAARSGDDAAALAHALNVLGMQRARAGETSAAEQLLHESLTAARTAGDQVVVVAALNNLARLALRAGRLDEALRLADEALQGGARHGDRHRLAALHTNLADALRAAGRSEESMVHLKLAAEIFADVDDDAERNPGIWTLVEW